MWQLVARSGDNTNTIAIAGPNSNAIAHSAAEWLAGAGYSVTEPEPFTIPVDPATRDGHQPDADRQLADGSGSTSGNG